MVNRQSPSEERYAGETTGQPRFRLAHFVGCNWLFGVFRPSASLSSLDSQGTSPAWLGVKVTPKPPHYHNLQLQHNMTTKIPTTLEGEREIEHNTFNDADIIQQQYLQHERIHGKDTFDVIRVQIPSRNTRRRQNRAKNARRIAEANPLAIYDATTDLFSLPTTIHFNRHTGQFFVTEAPINDRITTASEDQMQMQGSFSQYGNRQMAVNWITLQPFHLFTSLSELTDATPSITYDATGTGDSYSGETFNFIFSGSVVTTATRIDITILDNTTPAVTAGATIFAADYANFVYNNDGNASAAIPHDYDTWTVSVTTFPVLTPFAFTRLTISVMAWNAYTITPSTSSDVTIVGISPNIQTQPLWVSEYNPAVTDPTLRESRNAQPLHRADRHTTIYAAVCVARTACGYIARTRNGKNEICAVSPVQKDAIEQISNQICDLYHVPRARVVLTVCTFDEYQKALRNRNMHTLNGNTSVPIYVAERAAQYDEDTRNVIKMLAEVRCTSPKGAPVQIEVLEQRLGTYREQVRDFLATRISDSVGLLRYEGRLVAYLYPELELEDAFFTEVELWLEQYDNDLENKRLDSTKETLQQAQSAVQHAPAASKIQPGGSTSYKQAVKTEQKHADGVRGAEHVRNYVNAKRRHVNMLKARPESVIPWYNTTSKSLDYVRNVLEDLWGKRWEYKPDFTSTQWVIYGKLTGLHRVTILDGLLSVFPENVTVGVDYSELIDLATTPEHQQVLLAEKKAHNKKMHADNGNTGLSRTMADVDLRPTFRSLVTAGKFSRTSPELMGSSIALTLGFQSSSANPQQTDIYQASTIRGDTINGNTNQTTNNVMLNLPSTVWFPREVRNGPGAALIAANARLPTFTIGTTQFMTGDLTQTTLGATIQEIYTTGNAVLGRADSTTIGGFQMIDVAQQTVRKGVYGLVMDQCLLKLEYLHSYKAWFGMIQTLPLAQFSAIDQYTIPAPVLPVDEPNGGLIAYGETFAGGTVFPFGGEPGTIAFHLTLETVPIANRSNALFLPTGLIKQDESLLPGVAISLFALMWSPWPNSLYGVNQGTTDTAGGNGALQYFTHMGSLCYVPGLTVLDIILPRRTTATNPTTQARANELAEVQPQTGPAANADYPVAGAGLDVNFVGGGYASTPLCTFLETWQGAWDITTIANYIGRLSYITGIDKALERVHDIVLNTAHMFPLLTASPPATPLFFTVNSVQQTTVMSANCVSLVPTTVNWPQPLVSRGLITCNATDIIAWNKVANVLSVASEKGSFSYTLREYIGNNYAPWWEQCCATVFGAFWTSFLSAWGWSSETWNTVYTNQGIMTAFRKLARGFITNPPTQGKMQTCAYYGPMLANAWQAMTNTRLGTNSWGSNIITIFDNYTPRAGDANTVADNVNFYTHTTPCVVPDIVCQIFLHAIPKFQTSFPVPSGPNSTVGYFKGLHPLGLNDNVNAGGLVNPGYVQFMLKANQTADYTDDVRWNERLLYVGGTAAGGVAVASTMDAVAVPTGLPANTYATQRSISFPPVFPALAQGLFAANTICYATTDNTGRYTYAITTLANIQIYRRAMYHQSRLNFSAWLMNDVVPFSDPLREDTEMIESIFAADYNSGKEGSSSLQLALGGEDKPRE